MELSIPPPFSDPSTVPPNTPSTTADIRDSTESFKFPVEEIIKGLDQVRIFASLLRVFNVRWHNCGLVYDTLFVYHTYFSSK